jgi:TolB-like protein/class 3 adenylate cyclase
MQRRLTTIVAADIAGFARLVGADEEGVLTAQRAHRAELIDPLLERHGGRVANRAGDSLLIEFPSAVEAVRCALAVQAGMLARNRDTPEDRRIEYRVGVNVGDVVAEGDDLLGDGVNVAARLEQLCQPGGIVLSRSARDAVRDRMGLRLADMGEIAVKNIARPVRAFRVLAEGEAAAPVAPAPVASTSAPKATARRLRPLLAGGAVAAALVAAGVLAMVSTRDGAPAAGFDAAVAAEAAAVDALHASVLVLPFEDRSEAGDLGHFADGMTEDLIAELSRWRELHVIARNTANTFKGRAVDVRAAAAETGVAYVLEGSVRRVGDALRVTARLVDGASAASVWADRFDETGSDVLALQEGVTRRLLETLIGTKGVIAQSDTDKAWRKAAVDLDEYDYYLRGHDLFYRFTPQDNARAIEIWREGRERFPDSGLLKIKEGWGHVMNGRYGWSADRAASLAEAARLAEEGLRDPALPAAGHRFGLWLQAASDIYHRRDLAAAVHHARRLAEAFPYDPETLFTVAHYVMLDGEMDLARGWLTTALARDRYPRDYFLAFAAEFAYVEGRFEDAAAFRLRMKNLGIREIPVIAASLVAAGRPDEARALLGRLARDFPDFTPAVLRASRPYRDPAVMETMLARLAEAGWPPAAQAAGG